VLVAGGKAGIAHVGDCRVSRVRDGEIEALTRDHSLREEYADRSEAERRAIPAGLVTRVLGANAGVDVDRRVVDVRSGDVILLVTRASLEAYGPMELATAVRARNVAAATYLVDRARRDGKPIAFAAVEIR
jgi:protein phosphatase